MGAAEATGESAEPRARLTAGQLRALLTYARVGAAEAAAVELGLSPQTVKNHLTAIYSALGVQSNVQAIYEVMGGDEVARRSATIRRLEAHNVTPAQQRSLLAFARVGRIRGAAAELGISAHTTKLHLAASYVALGVRNGSQAIFFVMGGEGVRPYLPAVSARRPSRSSVSMPGILGRLEHYKVENRELRAENVRLGKRLEVLERRLRTRAWARFDGPVPAVIPAMHDGAIRLADLRRTARLVDNEADAASGSPRATLTEWIDFLAYYVRPVGTTATDAPD